MIPYGRQSITDEDIKSVVDVLKSDFLTQGPAVPKFEQAVCDYTSAKYAVAVNSGTAALHIACKSLGLGEGDLLWTTPISFVASANCGLYCGAKVDFVDIDPITWNICAKKLHTKLKIAKELMLLPKVIVVVHLSGLPCDLKEIYELSQEYGFHIIEDACHAIGGKYNNEPIGCSTFSDITVFSFHPVKTITTGEGGMAVTNSKNLADKMQLLRSHGITRDQDMMATTADGPWYYEQIDLGFNYRMTDIQAALGYSQLKRLNEFVQRRHEIAGNYDTLLADIPLQLPARDPIKYSGMHLYVIRLKLDRISKTHKQVFESLRKKGIGVNLHYIPIHTQPYYSEMGFNKGDFPQAELYYQEAISLPMYPGLSDSDLQKIATDIRESL
jgi:UDP-4-amino-4,6-dideoxy-N-acetyl-beta-L-altrosamine transaminase